MGEWNGKQLMKAASHLEPSLTSERALSLSCQSTNLKALAALGINLLKLLTQIERKSPPRINILVRNGLRTSEQETLLSRSLDRSVYSRPCDCERELIASAAAKVANETKGIIYSNKCRWL